MYAMHMPGWHMVYRATCELTTGLVSSLGIVSGVQMAQSVACGVVEQALWCSFPAAWIIVQYCALTIFLLYLFKVAAHTVKNYIPCHAMPASGNGTVDGAIPRRSTFWTVVSYERWPEKNAR